MVDVMKSVFNSHRIEGRLIFFLYTRLLGIKYSIERSNRLVVNTHNIHYFILKILTLRNRSLRIIIISIVVRSVINVGPTISVELGNRVYARNWSCRLGGQMGACVKALQAGTTQLVERVFHLPIFMVVGYTQIVTARRDLTTQ